MIMVPPRSICSDIAGTNCSLTASCAHSIRLKEICMRLSRVALIATALACLSTAAAAQITTTTPSTSPQTGTQQPPVAGANSFTEDQAQDHIQKAGFTDVKGLKKDDMQSGKQVSVALDFQGKVVANP